MKSVKGWACSIAMMDTWNEEDIVCQLYFKKKKKRKKNFEQMENRLK